MDALAHRMRMTRIERFDADLFGFYPLARSALAYGVRRVLAALRLNKAKRRGLAALHTLRGIGHSL